MAALNFPLNPSDGDTYNGYVYDATAGVWNADPAQIITRFSTSSTQPSSPSEGDAWFDPSTGKTYIYYDGYWVESGNPVIGGVEPYDVRTTATGFFSLPSGTTAQRPDTPQNGDIRFNTTLGEPEWYSEDSEDWFLFRQQPSVEFSLDYLVVAGGASGGTRYGGGGGGAGGYRSSITGEDSGGGATSESTLLLNSAIGYTVTIGAGGAAINAATTNSNGNNGSNSSFYSITSIGGGAGGAGYDGPGAAGGSGGGGGVSYSVSTPGGAGTFAQGYSGGAGLGYANPYAGGGGGGASQSGAIGASTGGKGGDGVASSISGSSITRAGGGGGGCQSAAAGAGGAGGGGAGGSGANSSGVDGGSNTGGGGGGTGHTNTGQTGFSGSGGSGIVILKYPSNRSISVGEGLVSTTSIVGEYKVTQFTAGSDTVTFS